jgi:hypothetical protein
LKLSDGGDFRRQLRTGNRHREHSENEAPNRATPPIGAPPFVRTAIGAVTPIRMPALVVPQSEYVLQPVPRH